MSFATLSAFSTALNAEYIEEELSAEDYAWAESPFDWIRSESSATKGSIGRELAASILAEVGTVSRIGMALEVNGKRVRVKFSMAWDLSSFRFQQVRDEPFDYVFCLGLYPDSAYGWFIPREEFLVDGVWQERDSVTGQHGGAIATGTKWMVVDPTAVPPWLVPFGGSLAAVEARIASVL